MAGWKFPSLWTLGPKWASGGVSFGPITDSMWKNRSKVIRTKRNILQSEKGYTEDVNHLLPIDFVQNMIFHTSQAVHY